MTENTNSTQPTGPERSGANPDGVQMVIAIGQLQVASDPQQNLRVIEDWARRSAERGARLLVLPEGIIARDPKDSGFAAANAQELEGPFVSRLRELSAELGVAIVGTVHLVLAGGGVGNFFLALDGGEIIAKYQKLHPYDAFGDKESAHVTPGDAFPEVFEIEGVSFGPIICYDLRFPDLSQALALAGAEVILCPAAWVRGPLKEQHWSSLITARALDSTCWVVGCGEISDRNVGRSVVVDPLGVTVAATGAAPALFFTEIDTAAVTDARRRLPVLQNRRLTIGTDPTPVR